LAYIFNENGSPESGLVQYQRALEYFRQTPGDEDDNTMVQLIGYSYYLKGDYASALTYLEQALASFPSSSLYSAQCHEYLGRVHIAKGEYSTALPHLESAQAVYRRTFNPKEEAQVQALIGQMYQQQGKIGPAQKNYLRALKTFNKLSDRINQAAVYYKLGQLELKQQHYDSAEEYLRSSIEVTEDIRRVPTSRDLTAAFSATVHDRYQSYIESLMRKAKRQSNPDLAIRAFQESELARARSLAELLKATETNLTAGIDPQLAQQEKSLRQALRAKEDYRVTLLSKPNKEEDLAALDAEISRLQRDFKAVSQSIRVRYPLYRQITEPDAWNLPRIQEQIIVDDQTVLLEYMLGNERSYVWVITRNSIKSYELPAQALINEAAHKVQQLLKTSAGAQADGFDRAAQELSQMILFPVGDELNKRRIIVVADDVLNYIPFQVLPKSSISNEPLIATAEVINAPSASILGQLREETARRQAPTKLLVAFGDPVFESNYSQRKETGSNEYVAAPQSVEGERWRQALRDIDPAGDSEDPSTLESLFYTKFELANLRDAAGPESLMITSFDATRENLASLDLTKYAILHFATHGVFDPKQPEISGLFLSMVNREGREQNGFVGLQDIYSLHAPVELVVLSACSTGLGKDVRGEGLIGLTRGFMYAGASSVVASLWKVDDEATAELMKQFYANMLQHGMPPASALREAQNSIRHQPQWRSPYYWAAFTLQGDSSRVIKTARVRWMPGRLQIVFGLSLLLLLVAAAHWYRRSRLATSQRYGRYSTVKK
jgi:CHAT domain-containing protein/Flp pilus assembly protein TadD